MKYLAGAIVFAALLFAVLFRYDYQQAGLFRIDRWTGERTQHCSVDGDESWLSEAECFEAMSAKHRRP